MRAVVITLMEMEESVQCADRCIRSGKAHGIEISKFPAVGRKESQEVRKSKRIPLEGFREKWSRLDSVVGCFMSHYKIWEYCVDAAEEFLIFEHDAVIVNNIPDVAYSGVLSLGKPSYGNYQKPTKLGVNKLCSKQYFPGAHGYKVKPSAAKLLIEEARKSACPTDVFLHNQRFGFLEEYYPWPVEARDTFTTVQNQNGIQAKHSFQLSPEIYRVL